MKNELNVGLLQDLLETLEGLSLEDDDDTLAVVAESSLDESMLVGSSSACLKLACELIRIATAFEGGRARTELVEGNIVSRGERMTDSIKAIFDEDADAWPVCVCVTPSKDVTRAVRDALKS